MNIWSNLVGYQIVWFVAVIGAGRGLAWPAVLAACAFVAWQLATSRHRLFDLHLIGIALLLGLLLDGSLAFGGWLRYAAAAPAVPSGGAPLWILALWAAFALTLTKSLRFLHKRLWLAAAFGALGGPLAYLGAERGWGAVVFVAPAWQGLLGLALGWALAIVILTRRARRLRPRNDGAMIVLPWNAS